MSWIGRLFGRRGLERDLDRELRFHLDAAIADHVRSGMSRADAERQARIDIGGVEQVKEEVRDARGTRWVEDLVSDTKYALRGMARTPAFSAAAVLTLAVGIGANTAVWSIVDALMLRSLPIDRPEQLHAIRRLGVDDDNYRISYPLFRRMATALPDSTQMAAMSSVARMYVTIGDNPTATIVQLVSGEWFRLLGVHAERGRLISMDDNRNLGGHPVAVLSDTYWRTRFGSDSAIVGKVIRVNGTALTVIGVTEPEFVSLTVGQPVAIWAPIMEQQELRYQGNASSSNSDNEKPWVPQNGISWLTVVARAPADSVAAMQRRIDVPFRADVATEAATRDSVARQAMLREHAVLEAIPRGFSQLRDVYQDPLKILMASVALVLLIACGNLAGLMLARSAARTHEMSVRVSLGAPQGRLVRQLLTESLTLAAIGGALSLLVAKWGTTALLKAAAGGPRPLPIDANLGWRVLVFAIGIALLTGILFGIGPALRITRSDLYETFRSGGRVLGSGGSHRLPLGRMLVVSQIALSLVLVTSAGLFVRTLQNLMSIDTGYQPDRTITALIDVRAAGINYDQLPPLYQRLLESVQAVPGVKSASLSLTGLATGSRRTSDYTVPGRDLSPQQRQAQENTISPGFFETVGISLLKGRAFTDADNATSPKVAVVSVSTAKQFFGTDDVVGKRFGYGTPPDVEIVGVVADARVNSIRETPQRLVFYPLAQRPRDFVNSVEIRVAGPPDAIINGVKNAVTGVDKRLPLREVTTVKDLLERGLTRERLVARLAGAFGVIALLLAGIGLYGVIGYSVSRRTNEMGVRLALGASPAGVGMLVVRDSMTTVVIGLILGLLLWFPLLGLTTKLVFGLSPHDPLTLAAGVGLMALAGCAAALLPAVRASRVDPVEAIRSQ